MEHLRLKRLTEDRAKIGEKMKKFSNIAIKENRDLTTLEVVEFENLEREYDELSDQIEILEQREQKISETTQPVNENPFPGKIEGRIYEGNEKMGNGSPSLVSLGGFLRSTIAGVKNTAEDRYFSRALAEGSGSGSYTVPDVLWTEFWDKLRNKSVVFQAGVRTVPLITDTTKFPKVTADPTIGWFAENAEITVSDPTFEAVTFATKTVAASIKASIQLVQDSPMLEAMLEEMFLNAFREEIESAVLMGAGTNEPTGIYNTSGLATTFSAVGSELGDYLDLLYLQGHLEADKVQNITHITSPQVYTDLLAQLDTTTQHIRKPEGLAPILTTPAVPFDITVGGHTNQSAVISGDYTKCYLGIRMEPKLIVLRERWMDYLQIGFVCMARADVQLNPAAFARIIAIARAASAGT